jgi:hypothetical protein
MTFELKYKNVAFIAVTACVVKKYCEPDACTHEQTKTLVHADHDVNMEELLISNCT